MQGHYEELCGREELTAEEFLEVEELYEILYSDVEQQS